MINKRRLLIVDDEPDVTLTLKHILEEAGLFQVDTFNDPKMALSNFRSNLYDLLVLDIKMPYMNGFELFRQIKKVDDRVKVCFLTALSESSEYATIISQICPNLDENCVIRKPIDNEQLINRVNAMIHTN
jgi:DNA-binding response OmpR family regulator